MNPAVVGKIDSILTFRILPGADIMEEIQKRCEEGNIQNGVILCMMGSMNGARFLNPIPNEDMPIGYSYGEPIVLEGAIELVSGAGMICHNDRGEVALHVHTVLSDKDGRAYGGHLIPGNKALITTDVIIGVISGAEMRRSLDEQTGMVVFDPRQA